MGKTIVLDLEIQSHIDTILPLLLTQQTLPINLKYSYALGKVISIRGGGLYEIETLSSSETLPSSSTTSSTESQSTHMVTSPPGTSSSTATASVDPTKPLTLHLISLPPKHKSTVFIKRYAIILVRFEPISARVSGCIAHVLTQEQVKSLRALPAW
jgi:hypothetical protein